MKKEFELLAPAGSFEILKAVIEAGADAVYVGGSQYGARAYANNFTEEELLEAIDYVHLRGRKLFLTVNTLFKNQELNQGLYTYLLPYYERGLDAVIVQDFGVIAFLQEHFPDLPIHTSTQMTVTGVEGALLLKNLGAERVVLARELSLQEMKYIRETADVELEVFVHGALCYSYSGQCLFSSILGGRSGNRGRCAQPCRLPYAVLDQNKKEIKKESYILSLKDLCGISYLKKLREAGVYSLKIEGRMKQASYAAGVVAMYRKYIDLEKEVSDADMQALYDLGNRCGFTTRYFEQKNHGDMVTYEKPSYEKSNDALHQEIEKKYVGKKSKLPIRGHLVMKKGEPVALYVYGEEELAEYSAEVIGPEAASAINKPLDKDEIRQRMYKTGETPFFFTDIYMEMDEDIFVPNGVLNQLRRDALDALQRKMLQGFSRTQNTSDGTEAAPATESVGENEENQDVQLVASCETMEQVDKCLQHEFLSTIYVDSQIFAKERFAEELGACIEKIKKHGKSVLLRLPAIFRKDTEAYYREHIAELKKMPLDGFVIRNYEEIYFVSTNFPQAVMVADHSLYTYNDSGIAAFRKQKISVTTVPLELNHKEIRRRNNKNSEMVIYGYYPLMTTAGCVMKNACGCRRAPGLMYLRDRYQVLFPVKNYCKECYNMIYNSVPTILFEETERLKGMGICRLRLDFTIETAEETERILRLFEGMGEAPEHTKGHYKRGVE